MVAIAHSRLVTRKDEVRHLGRQHRTAKHGAVTDAGHDHPVQPLQQLGLERQLLIVLHLACCHPGGKLAILESGLTQKLVDLFQLRTVEQLRNLYKHRIPPPISGRITQRTIRFAAAPEPLSGQSESLLLGTPR